MIQFTPIKKLETNMKVSKIQDLETRQVSSNEMKIEYLQNKLKMKSKRLQLHEQKNKQLNLKLENLESQLTQKNREVQILSQKVILLESQLAKLATDTNKKNKIIMKQEVEGAKQKAYQQYNQKLSKMLTKQNNELILQKNQLKNIIGEYDMTLQQTRNLLQVQKQNNSLLQRLNNDLKLQVQELLFELRMKNKREDTEKLSEYEIKIEKRFRDSCNKQNEDQNKGMDRELVGLLKQRITNLEQQLNKSQSRCKQLQAIILSK